MSSKTRRPIWAVLRGDILEHFLAFTPGAPEANLLAVFWLNLQEKEKRESVRVLVKGMILSGQNPHTVNERISVARRRGPFRLFSAVMSEGTF